MFLSAGKLEEAASTLNITRYILNSVLKGISLLCTSGSQQLSMSLPSNGVY